ncbi:MAG: pyridoxal-phosphate dependent enzyme [Rhodobacteraceae bacterium]|nr:pyridoxal-phosphate dependent enzyme [Paracoccaceae bacterium]
MGLGSFKALGAASVIATIAQDRAKNGVYENVLSDMTFVTASAGNHGLSVVAGANAFGAKAVIYLAETVPVSFQEKLRSIGAEVVVEGVDYEASMSAAEQSAKENDWFLLSDSTWPGYAVGADVMKGYMLSAKEIVEQCPEPPTHLFALDALARNANDFMTLTDQDVEKELPRLSELGLDTSPSGGAGLAAALIGASQGEFGLKATSRVMCIVSEGAVND